MLLSSTGESWYSNQLQKDKLIAVPPVVADFAWGQNVIAAVTFKSVILTAALHKCEDGVLLLWWWQSLRGQQNLVNAQSQNSPVLPLVRWISCFKKRRKVTCKICECPFLERDILMLYLSILVKEYWKQSSAARRCTKDVNTFYYDFFPPEKLTTVTAEQRDSKSFLFFA